MPNLETEILHYIFETTGIIIIASSYFMIFVIIIQEILQPKQRRVGQ